MINVTVAPKEQTTLLDSSNQRLSFFTFFINLVGTFFPQLGPRALVETQYKPTQKQQYFDDT
jgi:hypothetical protein